MTLVGTIAAKGSNRTRRMYCNPSCKAALRVGAKRRSNIGNMVYGSQVKILKKRGGLAASIQVKLNSNAIKKIKKEVKKLCSAKVMKKEGITSRTINFHNCLDWRKYKSKNKECRAAKYKVKSAGRVKLLRLLPSTPGKKCYKTGKTYFKGRHKRKAAGALVRCIRVGNKVSIKGL